MADINISPNMSLPVPVVGVDAGPDWANNINSCLTILDQHTHSAGSGIQITPAGININSDFLINGNDLTIVRTTRYQVQSSVIPGTSPDLNCVYVSGVDLYYNDGSGNQVRITQSGNVAGTPGSISGLVSPASATYNGGTSTFIWQSAANTPANMDLASAVFRNVTASSNGITVSAPAALASNYTLTLPSLPASQSFMTLDNSGNISAPWTVDNSTLAISGSNVIVKDNGITTAKIVNENITQPKIYKRTAASQTATAGNVALSPSCGIFSTSSFTPVDVTNMSVTITTTGRPVMLLISPKATTDTAEVSGMSNLRDRFNIILVRDGSIIQQSGIGFVGSGNFIGYGSNQMFMDVPAAGTYEYKIQIQKVDNNGGSIEFDHLTLLAYELN